MWVAVLGTPFLSGVDGRMEKIFRIYKHPFYNLYSLDYDVALLELAAPVGFGHTIRPICLPDNSHVFHEGARCFITGWGSTKEGGTARGGSLSPTTATCHRPHEPHDSHSAAPGTPHASPGAGDTSVVSHGLQRPAPPSSPRLPLCSPPAFRRAPCPCGSRSGAPGAAGAVASRPAERPGQPRPRGPAARALLGGASPIPASATRAGGRGARCCPLCAVLTAGRPPQGS